MCAYIHLSHKYFAPHTAQFQLYIHEYVNNYLLYNRTHCATIIIYTGGVHMDSFGSKLNYLRTSNNLSQAALAELLGVSSSTIRMIEKDERNPSLQLFKKFLEFYKVSADDLIFGSNSDHCTITDSDSPEDTCRIYSCDLQPPSTIKNNVVSLNQNNITSSLLKQLVENALITDEKQITEDIMQMITNIIKIEISLLLKIKKNSPET